MNFLFFLAFLTLCLANIHLQSASKEERIRNQLIKKEAFLQEKLLNVRFGPANEPEVSVTVSNKRDQEDYINVTDKVTITPWYDERK